MSQFKAICTLTWQVDSDTKEDCLNLVRKQIEELVKPPVYEDFRIQLDVANMKSRQKLNHIAIFSAEDIFPLVTIEDYKHEFVVNGVSYFVKMNSDRYHVFKENRKCVACHVEGTKMILDLNPGDSSPHFNLYAEENGHLLLMTKDHKIPKSKGGEDNIENYSTMCNICNNIKGNFDISHDQIKELRTIHSNPDKLPRRELRALLNQRRDQFQLEIKG